MLIALALVIALGFVLGNPSAWLRRGIGTVEALGWWGPAVFVLVYAIAAVLMVPGSALTLAAGTLFGVVAGTGIVSLASTLGAAAAFLVGRFLARDAIAARTAANPAFAALDRALGRQGWKIVMLARLSPLFPYTLLNYAFALTRVSFGRYVLASWAGMLPGTLLYVYLGSLARAGLRSAERSSLEWAFYGVGLAATLAVTIFVTRMARSALRESGLEPQPGTDATPRAGGIHS